MSIRNNFYKEKGITLIELLIVTGLISLLITGLIVLVNPLQKIGQSRDAKRKADLTQLQRALEIYYQDNGSYPVSTGTYTISGTGGWGSSWAPYMALLPKDPVSSRVYAYFTPNSGVCSNYQCYYIFANLERGGQDPQVCFPGSGNPCTSAVNNGLANACGGASFKCIYGVSSPNVTP